MAAVWRELDQARAETERGHEREAELKRTVDRLEAQVEHWRARAHRLAGRGRPG